MKFETAFMTIHTHQPTSNWAIGREMFALFERPEHDLRPAWVWGDVEKDKVRYHGPDSAEPFWFLPAPRQNIYTPSWERSDSLRSKGGMKHFSIRKVDGFPLAGGPTITGTLTRSIDFQLLFNQLCVLFEVEDASLKPSKWGISGAPEDAHLRVPNGLQEITTDRPWICFNAHSACFSPRHLTDAIFESVIVHRFPYACVGKARMVSVSENIFDVIDSPDWHSERQNLLRHLLNPEGRKLKKRRQIGPGLWEEYEIDA
ncbi:hypothetical protein ACJMQP_28005 (plasmid) [Rhodopseudomonas palustris]